MLSNGYRYGLDPDFEPSKNITKCHHGRNANGGYENYVAPPGVTVKPQVSHGLAFFDYILIGAIAFIIICLVSGLIGFKCRSFIKRRSQGTGSDPQQLDFNNRHHPLPDTSDGTTAAPPHIELLNDQPPSTRNVDGKSQQNFYMEFNSINDLSIDTDGGVDSQE